MKRNIEKIYEKRVHKINQKFDMNLETCNKLAAIAPEKPYEVIAKAFIYGYEMGVRATKKKLERKKA